MAGGDQPALRQVLMVAKACFVLGLVMAVIGLVAATSNPADFQVTPQLRHLSPFAGTYYRYRTYSY